MLNLWGGRSKIDTTFLFYKIVKNVIGLRYLEYYQDKLYKSLEHKNWDKIFLSNKYVVKSLILFTWEIFCQQ